MGLRSQWFLLLAPLAYACGAEGDPRPDGNGNELPFGMEAPVDAGPSEPITDASTKPITRKDGGSGWVGEDPLNADSACAASSLAAEQIVVEEEVQVEVITTKPAPVALYVMFDKSMSMQGSLWTSAVEAMTSFVKDPGSSGMDMALQYFPGGGSCDTGSGYSTPSVALGRLPEHAGALVKSLAEQGPNGLGTPIEGALRGVTQYCIEFQKTHADERCVAVLVTDGKPEFSIGCEENNTKLAAIASDAWLTHKVRTFAVGLKGADFGLLDQIARAGGAEDCDQTTSRFSCDVSGGTERLATALASIRDTVKTTTTVTEIQTQTKLRPLECEWHMPAPSADMTLDKDRVNVTLSKGGSDSLGLGRVPSAAECQAGAWYFDSPSAPERIIACPQTCESIATTGYTEVNILLGCETKVLVLL